MTDLDRLQAGDGRLRGEPGMGEVLLMLGRMEGKVDAFLMHSARHDREIAELEDRVMTLERSKLWLIGAAAGVGAAVSVGFSRLTAMLGGSA